VLSNIPEFTEHVYLKVARMLEDTKRLIGRKTHNSMVKEEMVKMINNDLQNTTQKIKIQHQVPHWIPSLVFYSVFCGPLFDLLSFYIVCFSKTNDFWLQLWYLQTVLAIYSKSSQCVWSFTKHESNEDQEINAGAKYYYRIYWACLFEGNENAWRYQTVNRKKDAILIRILYLTNR
jgi:hypothetical protein